MARTAEGLDRNRQRKLDAVLERSSPGLVGRTMTQMFEDELDKAMKKYLRLNERSQTIDDETERAEAGDDALMARGVVRGVARGMEIFTGPREAHLKMGVIKAYEKESKARVLGGDGDA